MKLFSKKEENYATMPAMSQDVEIIQGLGAKPTLNETKSSLGWMLYFLMMIALVGGSTAYLFTIPLCLIGRFYRPAWILGGKILCFGVSTLMKLQPWFNAEVNIKLPTHCRFVTVSNHRSHLDMFILLYQIPNMRVLSKRALFYVPFLGVMMRVMRNIPVKRGDSVSYLKAMDLIEEAIGEGDPVHVFPEMTRCETGFQGVQNFHLAPFRVFKKMSVQILPIIFEGTDEVWPKDEFGIVSGRKVKARSLAPVDTSLYKTAEELRDAVRSIMEKELCK